MTFRDAEKTRYSSLKHDLFSPETCQPGTYNNIPRDFCLADGYSNENLHQGFREEAIDYFRDRRIPWHDGHADERGEKGRWPSNHLCCSQCACVNALWPMTAEPELLAHTFRPFFPKLAEPLPFDADEPLPDGSKPFLAFEWIGTRNYLDETGSRTRGAHTTSADFSFRFRRYDGRIQLVLGEWKYTESSSARDLYGNKTRRDTYLSAFERWNTLEPQLPEYRSFFVQPFYQLMRLTLLAREMEDSRARGEGEMESDVASVLVIAPKANRDYQEGFTADVFKRFGRTVTSAWAFLAPADRYLSASTESLLTVIEQVASGPHHGWRDYLLQRYGWWR